MTVWCTRANFICPIHYIFHGSMSTFIAIHIAVQMSSVWSLWRGNQGVSYWNVAPHTLVTVLLLMLLTNWGRVTHICINELTIIGSDNGLSPGRRQAIIWNNDGLLLIEPLGTKLQWNFNQNSNIFIQENALEHVVCEIASILSRPQCVNSN